MYAFSCIEPLETRIAPAAIVTFTDLDGDLVTVKSSKGTLAELQAAAGDLTDHRLQTLDLSGTTDFDGTSITITATPQHGHGDGLVNIGRINATGRVLGSVLVAGDLGVLDAGNVFVNAVAVQSLTVQSIGEYRLETGASDLNSDVAGAVKSITVKGDIRNALINITGEDPKQDPVTHANRLSYLGALSIGGSLLATNTSDLGSITVNGDIGSIKIGGSVLAGGAQNSAQIGSLNGSIGPLTIGGDLIGGIGGFSGYIFAAKNIGAVTVGGDVRGSGASGSSNGDSGLILAGAGSLGAVKIGGSLIGGAGTYCGSIAASTANGSTGTMGAVTIGGSVVGGGGSQSGFLYGEGGMGKVTIGADLAGGAGANSGFIETGTGDIGGLSVRGSMLGGSADYTGSIAAGAFAAGSGKLGPVVIGGAVTGGASGSPTRSGLIDAFGSIASVSIGGSLTGGAASDSGDIVSSAALGAIKIGGDVAGGTQMRTGIIHAKTTIASVVIGGSLVGTAPQQTGAIMTDATIHELKSGSISIGGSVVGGGDSSGGLYGDVVGDDFGAIKVGGDWKGGSGAASGALEAGRVAAISVGGSLVGGSMIFSGRLQVLHCASVTIGGDLRGGSGVSSGQMQISQLGSLTIGGSLIGGTGNEAGSVITDHITKAVIGHDLRGGTSAGSSVTETGYLEADVLDSLVIGGSLIAGQQTGAGQLTASGMIRGDDLGSIQIKGSIVGNATTSAQISALGRSFGTGNPDVVLKSLTVGGRVEFALISGGLDTDADAQIGSVKVAGDWVASSLIAGIDPTDNRVGDGNDQKVSGNFVKDLATAFSKIASITIGGQVAGKQGDPSVSYGFGAEEIGVFKVNGVALPLHSGKFNDQFAGTGAAGQAVPVGASPGTVVSDGFAVHVFEVA